MSGKQPELSIYDYLAERYGQVWLLAERLAATRRYDDCWVGNMPNASRTTESSEWQTLSLEYEVAKVEFVTAILDMIDTRIAQALSFGTQKPTPAATSWTCNNHTEPITYTMGQESCEVCGRLKS